ncbi:MAG: hypothetical protein QM675_10850, partial [Protaetiibacter sp.]
MLAECLPGAHPSLASKRVQWAVAQNAPIETVEVSRQAVEFDLANVAEKAGAPPATPRAGPRHPRYTR